jgi:hypothetical protein
MDYEEWVTAPVKEHKSNLVALLREGMDGTDEEIMERAFVIEETARTLNELTDHYNDTDIVHMRYSDGLNYWEIKLEGEKDA